MVDEKKTRYAITEALCYTALFGDDLLHDDMVDVQEGADEEIVAFTKLKLDGIKVVTGFWDPADKNGQRVPSKVFSGKAGFEGIKVSHLAKVAKRLGWAEEYFPNHVVIRVPLAAHGAFVSGAVIELVFPSFHSSLFGPKDAEPGVDDTRSEPIFIHQRVALDRARARLVLRLPKLPEAPEDSEVFAFISGLSGEALAAILTFMSTLKFLPRTLDNPKKVAKANPDELYHLLLGAGLVAFGGAGYGPVVKTGRQDTWVLCTPRSEAGGLAALLRLLGELKMKGRAPKEGEGDPSHSYWVQLAPQKR